MRLTLERAGESDFGFACLRFLARKHSSSNLVLAFSYSMSRRDSNDFEDEKTSTRFEYGGFASTATNGTSQKIGCSPTPGAADTINITKGREGGTLRCSVSG